MNSHRETFAERVLAAHSRRIAQEQAELLAKKRRKARGEIKGWLIAFAVLLTFCILFRAGFVIYDMYEAREKTWRTHPREYTGLPWWPSAPRQLRHS